MWKQAQPNDRGSSAFDGKKHYLPTHIHIRGSKTLPKDSIVLAEQIRTIDRYRLKSYVGSVDFELMEKVEKAMKISIGVDFDD